MKRCLIDSSFLIDLLNDAADGRGGPAMSWLRRNSTAQIWISPVTWAEVMEGARDPEAVRARLIRYRWQADKSKERGAWSEERGEETLNAQLLTLNAQVAEGDGQSDG